MPKNEIFMRKEPTKYISLGLAAFVQWPQICSHYHQLTHSIYENKNSLFQCFNVLLIIDTEWLFVTAVLG